MSCLMCTADCLCSVVCPVSWQYCSMPEKELASQTNQACTVVIICIPSAGLWIASAGAPHPDTWEEDVGRDGGETDE